MKKYAILLALLSLLAACGGSEDPEAAAVEPVVEKNKANNPLAAEQQLIRDAEAIQGILNEDAEKKKKALAESN